MVRLMKSIFISLILFLLVGCDVPGPWEYNVEDIPVYKGVYVSGYVIADRKIENICFDKLYDLNEFYATGFAFYDSAQIIVSSGADSLYLSPKSGVPNCFEDTTGYVPLKGVDYALQAVVYWDSAGVKTATSINGVAQVPTLFTLKDSARYQLPDLQPQPENPQQRFTYLQGVNEYVKDATLDSLGFFNIETDTVEQFELGLLLVSNWDSLYNIMVHFDSIVEKVIHYSNGDTISYLYDNQNLGFHVLGSENSEDVGGLLYSRAFTDSALFPENMFISMFEGMFGQEFGPEFYYVSDTLSRTGVSENGPTPEGDSWLNENIWLNNIMFYGGLNTVYMYAMEPFYFRYISTAVNAESDPKTVAEHNVIGARGFFVGGVVDTFSIFVAVDSLRKFYTREETVVAFCNKQDERGDGPGGGGHGEEGAAYGWDAEKECRTYLEEYCHAFNYNTERCVSLVIEENILSGKNWDDASLLDSVWNSYYDSLQLEVLGIDTTNKEVVAEDHVQELLNARNSVEALKTNDAIYNENKERGYGLYCVENNFPTPHCDIVKEAAHDISTVSFVKDILIVYCEDRNWNSVLFPQCGPALIVHVENKKAEGKFSIVLEREAAQYCRAHPIELVCNL